MQNGRWIKKRACKDFVKLSLNVSFIQKKAEKGEFGAINFCAVGPLLGSSFTLKEQRLASLAVPRR